MSSKPRSLSCFSILGRAHSCRVYVNTSQCTAAYGYIAHDPGYQADVYLEDGPGTQKGHAARLAPHLQFSPLRLRTLQWPRGPPRMQDAISDAEIPRLHVQLLKRRASMPNATAKAGAPPLSRLPKGPVQANDGVQNQS